MVIVSIGCKERVSDKLTAVLIRPANPGPSSSASVVAPASVLSRGASASSPNQFDVKKLCYVVFAGNDADSRNFVHQMFSSEDGTHNCAMFGQHQKDASDVRVGCKEEGGVVFGQRFAITPGHGYDANLSAAGPPFGPIPNCGWN